MVDIILTWIGITLCITQAGMFSGLNLAMLGMSRLKLEVQAKTGNQAAARLLEMRKDTNFLLSTIVWGNVGANVLLTLLSDSVLTGVSAFAFSTIVITFGGEILPQAYFSRHVLRIARLLTPLLRCYQILLYPVAKPTALLLDIWVGREGIQYYQEKDLREIIRQHAESSESDVDKTEGRGALNFLAFDDFNVTQEGEPLDPQSILSLPTQQGRPVFPKLERSPADPFIQKVQASGMRWIIITSLEGEPLLALDANDFLRGALFGEGSVDPLAYCHAPLIVRDETTLLGDVITRLKVWPDHTQDDIIDQDIILVWAAEKRIITGADILGRLLRGIVKRQEQPGHSPGQ
jgi:metal transporter CNNM